MWSSDTGAGFVDDAADEDAVDELDLVVGWCFGGVVKASHVDIPPGFYRRNLRDLPRLASDRNGPSDSP